MEFNMTAASARFAIAGQRWRENRRQEEQNAYEQALDMEVKSGQFNKDSDLYGTTVKRQGRQHAEKLANMSDQINKKITADFDNMMMQRRTQQTDIVYKNVERIFKYWDNPQLRQGSIDEAQKHGDALKMGIDFSIIEDKKDFYKQRLDTISKDVYALNEKSTPEDIKKQQVAVMKYQKNSGDKDSSALMNDYLESLMGEQEKARGREDAAGIASDAKVEAAGIADTARVKQEAKEGRGREDQLAKQKELVDYKKSKASTLLSPAKKIEVEKTLGRV